MIYGKVGKWSLISTLVDQAKMNDVNDIEFMKKSGQSIRFLGVRNEIVIFS